MPRQASDGWAAFQPFPGARHEEIRDRWEVSPDTANHDGGITVATCVRAGALDLQHNGRVNGCQWPLPFALLSVALAIAELSAVRSPPANSGPAVDALLPPERFGLADIRAIHTGVAVVKNLDTPLRQELAVFGVVYIAIPAARFVDRFADIERFEKGPGISHIARFGNPPRLEDLAALTLPDNDLAALARCRPGDCHLKLSTAAMTRFRSGVDWSSPKASRQAQGMAREMILDLVTAYQMNGNAALGRYDDVSEPVAVGEEFRGVLGNSNQLPIAVPELMAYLDSYPRGRPAGAHEFFYWSMVEFGLKPTVRVNHVVIYPLAARPSGVSHVIAIKQLYASHYFHTALELRFLVEDDRPPVGRGSYLLSIIRSRADGTTGLKGSFLRPIITRRARTGVRGYLEYLKRQVERPASAPF